MLHESESDYFAQGTGLRWVIDAEHSLFLARYANDPIVKTRMNIGLVYLPECYPPDSLWCRANQDIDANSELFVPYGPEYWSQHP